MSVAHNHASVKAVVSRFAGRYDLNLRREEILFLYIIFLCKDLHDIGFYFFLDVVFFIRFRWNAADDQIEVFSLNDLGCLFLHLLSGKVDQKIAHAEYRITRLVSDTHFDHGAVLFRNDAVQSQRQCHPLVLLDTAVIVGIQHREIRVFIQRVLL